MRTNDTTVEGYFASLKEPQRRTLERLRMTILAIVPKATECISYGMPAVRVDGVVVAGFRATGKGCSYYPFSGTTLTTLAADIEGYSRTKSALHFASDKSLPVALVRKLLHARIAETKTRSSR